MISTQLSQFLIPKPFASKGTVTPIVNESDTMPNFSTGFPENFSAPHSGDGRYLARSMMNAVGNMATANEFYRQAGGLYTFNGEWARLNGGYPKGAVLDFLDGNKLYKVLSLVDNNLVDFTGNNPTAEQAEAGITAGGVDGVNWVYCNVDQEVKYNEICEIPNFTWQGAVEGNTVSDIFNGETFPIGYFKASRAGKIVILGTLDYEGTDVVVVDNKQRSGGFGVVACKKSGDTYPNPWQQQKGTLIYQRGSLFTYTLNSIAYGPEDLTLLTAAAGDEYVFYILNFGGNVSNSNARIVLI